MVSFSQVFHRLWKNNETYTSREPECSRKVMALEIAQKVRLVRVPPYVKTADAMPMLRSSAFLEVGQEGYILDRRPANYWAVRFKQGAYLIDGADLEAVS